MQEYCIFSACTMSSQGKFTCAISSPDEFLAICLMLYAIAMGQITSNEMLLLRSEHTAHEY